MYYDGNGLPFTIGDIVLFRLPGETIRRIPGVIVSFTPGKVYVRRNSDRERPQKSLRDPAQLILLDLTLPQNHMTLNTIDELNEKIRALTIKLQRTEQQRDLLLESGSTGPPPPAVHRRNTDPTSHLIIGDGVVFASTKSHRKAQGQSSVSRKATRSRSLNAMVVEKK